MVHYRLNARETNPNPHINFITALPSGDDTEEDARQLLRALAAQVRPVMKSHGYVVNSFEEYEYNNVFAGRNWNNGETVELVLRRPGGSFVPNYWLLSTLCHELAHIEHMNHGPDFQALWKQLRVEVRQLQDKGYYGDGYWSSGKRLADSGFVPGDAVFQAGELPEHMCGGAQRRSRPSASRKRRRPRTTHETVASNKTGRQTAKKRKPGARNTSKYAFQGEGSALNAGSSSSSGTGFRKQAGSKRAREERALAIENRLRKLQGDNLLGPSDIASGSRLVEENDTDGDDSDEVEFVAETDAERKDTLLQAQTSDDIETKSSWKDFEDDFVFISAGSGTGTGVTIDISSDEEDSKNNNVKIEQGKKSKPKNIVKDEIALRKQESLGMAPGSSCRLGGGQPSKPPTKDTEDDWACRFCTLLNAAENLTCSACDNLRPDIHDGTSRSSY